jgi:hypothetical protein
MNIQHLADRSYAMSRINISTSFLVIVQTPVIPILPPECIKAMVIRTLNMDNFS